MIIMIMIVSMATMVQPLKMGKMLIRDMPDEVRRAFKIACAEEDISMNRKVLELIKAYLKRKGRLK